MHPHRSVISDQSNNIGNTRSAISENEEIHPSGYLMNDSEHGSELSPPFPSGDGGDGHSASEPTHTLAGGTAKVSSLGRPSDSRGARSPLFLRHRSER